MSSGTRVYLEVGGKRVFASAADWPGWCRSGKDEASALKELAEYAPRYAKVAKLARAEFPKDPTNFNVIERMKGNATTDFGAPGVPAKDESNPLTTRETERMASLVEACWKYLDQVRAQAPASLQKGPRGGGRDRDKMFEHVLAAEVEYAKKIGLHERQPAWNDPAAIKGFRISLSAGFRDSYREEKWPVPYAARRTAWHALDHAWEMEDRIP